MDLPANCDRFVFSMGEKEFLVSSFTAREYLSRPFEIFVGIAHEDDFDADGFFGAPASLFIDSDESPRWFHGFVCAIERGAVKKGRFYTSRVKVVSRLHITTQIADCRVFMDMSTPEVVSSVLRGDGFTAKEFAFAMNPAPYPKKEHRTQYRETDFAFFSRLLEHEGIYYLFEHTDKDHRLVLADSPAAYRPIPEPVISYNPAPGLAPDKEVAQSFILGYQLVTGNIVLSDYNFKKPLLDLSAGHSADNFPELRRVDWPGNFDSAEEARRMAKVRLEQHQRDAVYAGGKSNCPRLIPGGTFTLADHYEDEFNAEYLITSVIHTGRQPGVFAEQSAGGTGFYYTNRFKAVPAQVPWRPSLNFPVPHIRGVQHAVVVGPANEEIHVDEYARVKVQFKWDRKGLMDEHSSCWMRVGEMEAGEGFGTTFIPRVGQEVLVEYLNGHPDKPLITSRVYNGDNLPPWALPDDKTQSGFKTDTSPGGGGCNQIRFDDRKNHEQLFIQAEKDHTVKVKNDTKTYVGGDSHLSVGRDELIATERDKHTRVGADSITRIGGNDHLTVEGDHAVKIDGNLDRVTAGPIAREIGGDYHKNVEGHYDVKALSLFAEADNEIAITVGGSFISIKPGCIDIHGPVVSLGGGRPDELQPLPFISPIAPQAPQGVAPLPAGRPPRKAPVPEAAKPPETKPLRIVPPKKSDEQPHKLAVEVAGATGAAVPGVLLAHGDNGIRQSAAFNGLDGGYRRQVFIKDILPGSYHLTYDLDGLKIPLDLGTPVDSVPEPAFSDRWDTIVIPIVPRAYAAIDLDRKTSAFPREGFVYLFANGHLWRELASDGKGGFRDVDLERHKGRDQRPATGPAHGRVLTPFQVKGTQPKLEICFAEVQWSWAQITALGGMNPDDPRLAQGPAVDPCPNPGKAAAYRKERLQPLDLSAYPDFDQPAGPIGSTAQKAADGTPLRPHLKDHSADRLPVVYLHDALGIAESLAEQYAQTLDQLRQVVAGLPALKDVEDLDPAVAAMNTEQKQHYFRSAVLGYRVFFDPYLMADKKYWDAVHEDQRQHFIGPQKSVFDFGLGFFRRPETPVARPDIFDDCEPELDRKTFENILQVRKRADLRAKMRKIKKALAAFLEDQLALEDKITIMLATERQADFIGVDPSMKDYANLHGHDYMQLWLKAGDIYGLLEHEPCSEDPDLDLAETVAAEKPRTPDKDPGVAYLDKLLDGKRAAAHAMLFPPEGAGIDENDPEDPAPPEPETADGSGEFRHGAFAVLFAGEQAAKPVVSTKSAAKLVKTIVANFLKSLQRRGKDKKQMPAPARRLFKAAHDPDLASLHLVPKGTTVRVDGKDGLVLAGIKTGIVDAMNKARVPDPIPSGVKTVPVHDARTGLQIGKTPATRSGLKGFKGIAPQTDADSVYSLWGTVIKKDGATYVKTRTDLIGFKKDSPYAKKYNHPDFVTTEVPTTTAKVANTVKRALSPMIAVMELMNFKNTVAAAFGQKKLSLKASVLPLISIYSLPYYMLDAARAITGEEYLVKALNLVTAENGIYKGMGKNLGSTLFKEEIKVLDIKTVRFNLWSARISTAGGLIYTWDMIESISAEDYDAAAGYGIAAAGSFCLALAKVEAIIKIGSWALSFGPYAWVFVAVTIIGTAIAIACKDEDLERWSKHGPFALNHEDRWTKAYKSKDTRIALEGLMGALMTPIVGMHYDRSKDPDNPDIVVTCHAPGYKPKVSDLIVHTSAQGTYLTDPVAGRLTEQFDGYSQFMQTAYRIEQAVNERTGQIETISYHYKNVGPKGHHRWRTRVRHVADWGVITPPLLDREDNFDPDSIGRGALSLGPFGFVYDTEKPGWVYAELWLGEDKES